MHRTQPMHNAQTETLRRLRAAAAGTMAGSLDLATRTGVLVAAICVARTPEIITGMRISRVSYVSFPNEAFGP